MRLDLPSCCVRDVGTGDAAAFSRHGNNRKIWVNLRDRFPHPYTLQHGVEFVARVQRQRPATIWTIDVAGEAAGTIGVVPRTDVERISAEVGYWLGEPFWGRGIMTEVLRAVTHWSMREFQLLRVDALPFATNAASCRVLEKAGYVCEGRLRRSAIKDGQILDQFMYAYIAGDDLAGKAPGR